MTRPWRIEYEGALYHVISRGNGGCEILQDDEDREMYLSVLGEMSKRFDIEVHAWVLMSNHYLCGAPHKKCYVKFQIM